MLKTGWGFVVGVFCLSCLPSGAVMEGQGSASNAGFGAYWYQGQAELTSYELEQARYGEIHPGHAVLIYVTEDFSRAKQVKLDRPQEAGDDAVKVLKLNFTKKFNTGIYPYSMMTSVFAPVSPEGDPHALKVTTSSQEWCGHTFVQMNRAGSGYEVHGYSYFESEGDESKTFGDAVTEDELWVTLRLDPGRLPTGEVALIPGTMFLRLRHVPWGLQRAAASLTTAGGADGLMAYTLSYPELGRTLTIRFREAFPHEIEGWEETYSSGFGAGARKLTTRATRKERMLTPYWTQNSLADAPLRAKLGLE